MSTSSWTDNGTAKSAGWPSENGAPPTARRQIARDALTANSALRRIRGGAGLLWRGDFPGARQLLTAIGRRADRRPLPKSLDLPGRFRAHRAARAERAELLGGIVVVIEPDLRLALRRAPDLAGACREADGELSGPALGPLNALAAVLARRGAARVTATDLNPRAVACARENMRRLGLEQRVSVMEADLFPPGRADLIVCNPPWLPGAPTSALELGIYDEGSGMLR